MLSLNQKRTILGIVIVLGMVGLVVGPLAYKIAREVDAEENGHLPSYILHRQGPCLQTRLGR